MNVHDSERIAGLLEAHGYVRGGGRSTGRRRGVQHLRRAGERRQQAVRQPRPPGPGEARPPGMQIAVGGCLAQKDREHIVARAPWVDVVFGTHNVDALPALLQRAPWRRRRRSRSWSRCRPSPRPCRADASPPTPPGSRSASAATTPARSASCPALRGKERDRRPGEILAEVEALVAEGVIEVTLLGQNVNAYGAEFGERDAFADLLRAVGAVPGIERVRFTSPHPRDFTDDVIDAMAETPTVMPSLHMPLQSGSDRGPARDAPVLPPRPVPGDPRRGAGGHPRGCDHHRHHRRVPRGDRGRLRDTLEVVERARFSAAFTFQYSPRPGTPAAEMADQIPKAVVQERYERLVEALERISWEENLAWSAPQLRCSWPRARGARTSRPGACRAGPGTAGSCTSRGQSQRGPVTA